MALAVTQGRGCSTQGRPAGPSVVIVGPSCASVSHGRRPPCVTSTAGGTWALDKPWLPLTTSRSSGHPGHKADLEPGGAPALGPDAAVCGHCDPMGLCFTPESLLFTRGPRRVHRRPPHAPCYLSATLNEAPLPTSGSSQREGSSGSRKQAGGSRQKKRLRQRSSEASPARQVPGGRDRVAPHKNR